MACINTAAMVVAILMAINIPKRVGTATKSANHIPSNAEPKIAIIYCVLLLNFVSDFSDRYKYSRVLFPKDCSQFVVHRVSSALDKNALG
jgi:hypothetical protein